MHSSPKKLDQRFTYKDYLLWPDDERWELIDGMAYDMSPAPTRRHQSILGKLFRVISEITDKGKCETYMAPFDIRLNDPSNSLESAGYERGAHGAPDLVVEILSPSTSYKDQTTKLALYERYGVKEYWLVNGDIPSVMVYRIGENRVFDKPDYYRFDESVNSIVLGGVDIPLKLFVDK
jgi:Uma2 family endonuclease